MPTTLQAPAAIPAQGTMQIVRIFGASYSGSTALGYALNTAESYFFGSETFRLLHSVQQRWERLKGQPRHPECDMCGADCAYWSRDLIERIRSARVDRLEDVYALFSAYNPDVAVYVDGSKLISCYRRFTPGKNLISVKHPMRMIASTIYNDRRRIGFSSKRFADLKVEIVNSEAKFAEFSGKYLRQLSNTYDQIFSWVKDGFVCRVDRMHENGLEGFDALSDHLELGTKKIFPTEFSKYPVHTLGGNRAPYWRVAERQQGRRIRNPRKDYYDTAQSIGDWALDDKYLLLFDDEVLDRIRGMDAYKRACACLGYDLQP